MIAWSSIEESIVGSVGPIKNTSVSFRAVKHMDWLVYRGIKEKKKKKENEDDKCAWLSRIVLDSKEEFQFLVFFKKKIKFSTDPHFVYYRNFETFLKSAKLVI
jgi:hypothetical protein